MALSHSPVLKTSDSANPFCVSDNPFVLQTTPIALTHSCMMATLSMIDFISPLVYRHTLNWCAFKHVQTVNSWGLIGH